MNVQLSQEVLKEAKYRTFLFFHTQTGTVSQQNVHSSI